MRPPLEEVIAVLRHMGLDIREWTTLSESERIVVALEPCALLAKIVPPRGTP